MSLLHRKFLRLAPAYIAYMAAVLWMTGQSASVRLDGLFLTQAFADKTYCYLLAPPFLLGIFFLDESMKKPMVIRIGSRRLALLRLLVRQYLFAAVYLAAWFALTALFAGGEDVFRFLGRYAHNLMGLLLLANCCELFQRWGRMTASAFSFGAAYLWLLLDALMIPSLTNRLPFGPTVYLGFAWVFSEKGYSYAILAGWIVLTFVLLLDRNERYDMF